MPIEVEGVQKLYKLTWYKTKSGSFYGVGTIDGVEDGIYWTTTASDIASAAADVNTVKGEKGNEDYREYKWDEVKGPVDVAVYYGPF